jgi:hypothetical protein
MAFSLTLFAGWLMLASAARATLPTPLLHYTFDEAAGTAAATDSGVSPGADGVFNGAATRTANTPNGQGYALDLSTSGVNDYVRCGDPAKLNNRAALSNAVTLTLWVNLRGNQSMNDRLISKLSATGGFELRFANSSATSAQPLYACDTTSSGALSSSVNLSGRWVFLAATYDGSKTSGNVVFYSGGTNSAVTLMNTTSWALGAITNSGTELRVGGTAASSADRTPPAWIDDVRIYDGVLSITDLEAVRAEGGLPSPLQFMTQPASQSVYQGASNLTLSAIPSSIPDYAQWYFNGTNAENAISGATNTSLVLSNVTLATAGTYSIFASNSAGGMWSSNAVVTVVPLTVTGRLTNLWNLLPGERSYITADNNNAYERGLAYNPVTGDLLLACQYPTNNIVVLNSTNGEEKSYMNQQGITGLGGSALNMVGVADDGVVYGANATANAGSSSTPYYLYRWDDTSSNSAPVVMFAGDPGYNTAAAGLRWGDNFIVRGAGATTQILIAPGSGTNVCLFTVAEGGGFQQNIISVSNVASGFGHFGLAFGPGTNTFWAKTRYQPLCLVQFDVATAQGGAVYSAPTNIVTNLFRFIAADANQKYLAGITTVSSAMVDNVSLFDISVAGSDPSLLDQALYATANRSSFLSGAGTGVSTFGGDCLFTLDSNNGIKAFRVSSVAPLSPFSVLSVTPQAEGKVAVSWQSVAGHVYQVQTRADLASGSWANVGAAISASGTVTSATNSVSGDTQFFRVLGQ